jgi:hypothetical protein
MNNNHQDTKTRRKDSETLVPSCLGGEGIRRIRAALQAFSHKKVAAWRAAKRRMAALSPEELVRAMEFEKLGQRRTEHLKLLDIELRRRAGDTSARKFRAEGQT